MESKYLLKKSVYALLTLLVAIVVNFAIPRVMPGDPIAYFIPAGVEVSPAIQQNLMQQFGLDKPVLIQFYVYVSNLFRGNLGISFNYYPKTVVALIAEKVPWTLLLVIPARILASVLAILLGTYAGWKRGKFRDIGTLVFSLFTYSMPVFWIGMVLLMVFGYSLGWFPLYGATSYGVVFGSTLQYIGDVLSHLFLPLVCLTFVFFGEDLLIMRNSMISVLAEDYILTAKAKGLRERTVMFKHAARNAILPMITVISIGFGRAIGGAILTETVFSWPGIGTLIFNAVLSRDYPLLQGTFFILALTVILANYIADIIYSIADPRIRH